MPTGPLTPSLLKHIGVIPSFPAAPGFDPAAPYVNRYRIWSITSLEPENHLARETGMLRIERLPMQENCLSFRILHRILLEESNGYGGHNDVTVEVLCANDALSTPLEWKLESTFTIANSERDNLSSRETGKFSNRQLTRSVNGIEYTFDISGRLAANWCLFDALQRSISDSHEPFTLFEGFNLIREGHRVRRRPDLDEAFDTATGNLRCSTQLGRGILPYEYWLDSSNRLVAAISGTRIYFLDDKAEEAIADREHNQFIYSGRGAWIPKI